MTRDLSALVLDCTLKPSPAPSSSMLLAGQVIDALEAMDVGGEIVRVVDHDVHFGVSPDEGNGDAWPGIRRKVLDADIVVIATPIWMGQPASVCKMVLERLDAELGEADDDGHYPTHGTDYNDLDETPEKTASTTKTLAANSVHLARLLRASPFPAA